MKTTLPLALCLLLLCVPSTVCTAQAHAATGEQQDSAAHGQQQDSAMHDEQQDTAAQNAESPHAPPGPLRVRLQAEAWGGKLTWQKAPTGPGAFLPMPAYDSSGVFEHHGRTYVATPLGVLGSRPEGGWQIVPEFYSRPIQPVNMCDGLLWAMESGHLAGLDPADWSTKCQGKLPDRPYTRVVAVESDGFWCLEDLKHVLGRPPRTGPSAIAHYAMDGQQRFRFDVPPGTPSPNVPQDVQAVSNPLIHWAAIDPDAVWLMVVDYQGIMPNDAPIYGFCGFVRIDRATGKHQAVEAHVWAQSAVLNLPERLLWLMPGHTPGDPARSFLHVYQLHKKKLEVSIAGKIDAPWSYGHSLATDGTNLWVVSSKTCVFSLKDLSPVPLEQAGPRPPGAPPDPSSLSRLHVLGSDARRVWLVGPGARVLELADDGSAAAWDLSRWVESAEHVCYPVARPGVLYFVAGAHLIRLGSGSAHVVARKLSDTPHGSTYHLAADELVWVQASFRGPITTVSPEDLSEVAAFEAEGVAQMQFQLGTAAGQSYYVFCAGPGRLVSMDGQSGEVAEIKSWREHAEKWCREHWGAEPAESDLAQLANPVVAAATPDGQVRFHLLTYATRSLYRRPKLRLSVWWYDPAADHWADRFLPPSVWRTSNPEMLYDVDREAILREQSGKWVAAGRLPEGWPTAGAPNWPMAATERHLYIRTPLGLYRVAWADIQAEGT